MRTRLMFVSALFALIAAAAISAARGRGPAPTENLRAGLGNQMHSMAQQKLADIRERFFAPDQRAARSR